ncbi:M24 family metallopeptidase [Oceanomicrobium pacificus]|uniref:M24 family metallopeptidase n=1 Tax=Oceanomicrobium pacificus TaxID=2692916 RepID=A0A6B0TKI2_9RHOB|nr:M24 family metallopeptidase [Oceanomicrobium pacificus]MXU65020.1 M24 family metallopeptidase [Oceanomicrobium pacificus]
MGFDYGLQVPTVVCQRFSVHEWPRLVPDETALIEENMVLMVEPGSYVPGLGGIRTEFILRVTRSGAEALATF